MKVFIYSGFTDRMPADSVASLIALLQSKGWEVLLDTGFYKYWSGIKPGWQGLGEVQTPEALKNAGVDICLSLGGDGTVLHSITWVRDTGIPLLGINLGRLGFLTAADIQNMADIVDQLEKGEYLLEQRTLVELCSESPYFEDFPYALNDFTLLKRDTSSMIAVHVELDGAYLNTYWADGFIVATPTGSTGYSLSCGGPIVLPNSGCLVLTPVAPHQLSVRPIIVNDATMIRISVEARTPNVLMTLDSRHTDFPSGGSLLLRKCPFLIHMVQLPEKSFLSNMREKLRWGSDSRIKF
jgi:NAD+ kinase